MTLSDAWTGLAGEVVDGAIMVRWVIFVCGSFARVTRVAQDIFARFTRVAEDV